MKYFVTQKVGLLKSTYLFVWFSTRGARREVQHQRRQNAPSRNTALLVPLEGSVFINPHTTAKHHFSREFAESGGFVTENYLFLFVNETKEIRCTCQI